jgi:cytochrome c553
MRRFFASLAAGALLSLPVFAEAGDVAAGRAKAAAACASCHGLDGFSQNPRWPNLAGQNAPYMKKQLRAFRDGTRKDPFMSPMAWPLSDQDIRNVAAFYESLPR